MHPLRSAAHPLGPGDRAVAQRLVEEVDAYNIRTTGIADARDLLLTETGEDGELLGGLSGWTWGGTCWIEALWVAEGRRRRGVGGRLLRGAEAIARERGCGQMALTTHTFQAPDFYAAHGFEEVGRLADHPRGHDELLLRKRLAPPAR